MNNSIKYFLKKILNLLPIYRVGKTIQNKIEILEQKYTLQGIKFNKQEQILKDINNDIREEIKTLKKILKEFRQIKEGQKEIKSRIQNINNQLNQKSDKTDDLYFQRLSDITPNSILSYSLTFKPEILKNLNSESICIDLGSNKGDITSIFLKFGARVHSFEPDVNMYNFMRYRFHNEIKNNQLKLYNKAVWTEEKTMKLYNLKNYDLNKIYLDRKSESSSLMEEKQNATDLKVSKEKYQTVECIDFTKFVQDIDEEIYILEIDIEGAEYKILTSLIENSLIKKFKYIFVELHSNKIPELKEKEQKLLKLIKDKKLKNIYTDWH